MYADQPAIERARPHRYLRAGPFGLLPQLLQLFNGRRKIGIGEQGPFSAALQHAVPHGVTLAAIARIAQHAQVRIFAFERSGNLHSAVGRPIIDHQHLTERPSATLQVADYLPQGAGQALLFVVGRNDNGD